VYASQNVTTLLEERGVLTSDLMPHKDFNMRVDLTQADPKNKRLYPPFLSLDIFDNTEYDCRNPQEWLNLGMVKGQQKPVPGKALLSLTGKDVADPDRLISKAVYTINYETYGYGYGYQSMAGVNRCCVFFVHGYGYG
jgi:dynein heavy chain